jgi:hypothetical protein
MHSSTKLLQQDNWYKNCAANDSHCSSDEKKGHQFIWMLTLLLAFTGFCNLLLNLTILIVLRVSQGMEAFEVIPEQDLVKFYGNTDLDRASFPNKLPFLFRHFINGLKRIFPSHPIPYSARNKRSTNLFYRYAYIEAFAKVLEMSQLSLLAMAVEFTFM